MQQTPANITQAKVQRRVMFSSIETRRKKNHAGEDRPAFQQIVFISGAREHI